MSEEIQSVLALKHHLKMAETAMEKLKTEGNSYGDRFYVDEALLLS